MNGKYIIFERFDGLEYPVLLHDKFVTHADVARPIQMNRGDKPISAGFFYVNHGVTLGGDKCFVFHTYGKSVSLNLTSREIDAKILEQHFNS